MTPTATAADKPAWRIAAERLFLHRDAKFWLSELAPEWSLRAQARVVRVIDETRDTRSFVLRPSRAWRGHRAGQYVIVEVEIDGVHTRRCYSISSAGSVRGDFSITVKRQEGGRVSSWMHDDLRSGDLIGIGQAAGDFVLPDPLPRSMLLISGGSGITPIFALLEELAVTNRLDDVVLVHSAPRHEDVIFRDRLRALADHHSGLRVVVNLTAEQNGGGRLDGARLETLVPDFRDRESWLCGPEGLMDSMVELWEREGIRRLLHEERFVAATAKLAPESVAAEGAAHETPQVTVTLTRAGRSFEAYGSATLLEQAERAGANPASGCRMGICQTCKCVKRSGAVRNLRSGAVSSEENEEIQLCISVALSDVSIDL